MEILTTERLVLRRFTPEIIQELFAHQPEKELKRLFGETGSHAYAVWYKRCKVGLRTHNNTFSFFQIRDKETDRILGGGGFHNYREEVSRAELGYALEKEADFRKGYMSEALSVIIPYGFNEMKLNRMEAFISPDNLASIKLVQRWHFTHEATLKEHFFDKGVFIDSLVYRLLKSEYSEQHHP